MPPQPPPHSVLARKRMKQGLMPEPTAARERMIREQAGRFENPPGALSRGPAVAGPDAPRVLTSEPQQPRVDISKANDIPALGPVTLNLGQGRNAQAGNARNGQGYRAFFADGKEYHRYGSGETVAFDRKQTPQLTQRAQAGMAETALANRHEQDQMAALAQAVAAQRAQAQAQNRRKRRPSGGALLDRITGGLAAA